MAGDGFGTSSFQLQNDPMTFPSHTVENTWRPKRLENQRNGHPHCFAVHSISISHTCTSMHMSTFAVRNRKRFSDQTKSMITSRDSAEGWKVKLVVKEIQLSGKEVGDKLWDLHSTMGQLLDRLCSKKKWFRPVTIRCRSDSTKHKRSFQR